MHNGYILALMLLYNRSEAMQNIKHGLYAFSGDCSKGAMGDTSDFIVFKKKAFWNYKKELKVSIGEALN